MIVFNGEVQRWCTTGTVNPLRAPTRQGCSILIEDIVLVSRVVTGSAPYYNSPTVHLISNSVIDHDPPVGVGEVRRWMNR